MYLRTAPLALLAFQVGCNAGLEGTNARWEGQYPGECIDGADNDRDGLFDCDDPDCVDAPGCQSDTDADTDTDTDADTDTDTDTGTGTDADTDTDTGTGE